MNWGRIEVNWKQFTGKVKQAKAAGAFPRSRH